MSHEMSSALSSNATTYSGSDWVQAPRLGSQLVTLAFVVVGCLAGIMWDVVSNINTDYYILRQFPITLTTCVYFSSRLATLVTFIILAIVNTRPMGDCFVTMVGTSWMMSISLSLTTLLFFLRVRAFYIQSPYVVWFFFILWTTIVIGCLIQTQIGPVTQVMSRTHGFCITNPIDILSLVTTMSTIPMINGTLSFFAITWRLRWVSPSKTTFISSLKTVIFGKDLPKFSRVLLQDGQIYFASTVSLSLLSTIVFYCKGIPRTYSIALVFPNVVVMNLMGCRIFRHTKITLAASSESSEAGMSQSIVFRVPKSDYQKEASVV